MDLVDWSPTCPEILGTLVMVHPLGCCRICSYMCTGLQEHVSDQIRCSRTVESVVVALVDLKVGQFGLDGS